MNIRFYFYLEKKKNLIFIIISKRRISIFIYPFNSSKSLKATSGYSFSWLSSLLLSLVLLADNEEICHFQCHKYNLNAKNLLKKYFNLDNYAVEILCVVNSAFFNTHNSDKVLLNITENFYIRRSHKVPTPPPMLNPKKNNKNLFTKTGLILPNSTSYKNNWIFR